MDYEKKDKLEDEYIDLYRKKWDTNKSSDNDIKQYSSTYQFSFLEHSFENFFKKISNLNFMNSKKNIFLIIIAIIIIFTLFSKILVIIPAGTVGVTHLFGKVNDNKLYPGLNIINPLLSVVKFSIRTEEYTMSSVNTKKGINNDSISALTKEGLPVDLELTVLYHLNAGEASNIYKEIGINYSEKIIRPKIRTVIRDVVATYEAKDIYSDKREDLSLKIMEELGELSERGIIAEQVLLRNVNLPEALTKSIEAKLTAEQEIERKQFEVEIAKEEAKRKQSEAEGIRGAQEIINNSLTPTYLKWYSIEMMRELAESPNTTFLFVPTDDSGTPIVNIMPQNN